MIACIRYPFSTRRTELCAMRMRRRPAVQIGDRESILASDDLDSIEERLDDLIEEMSVPGRNEAGAIDEAIENTIAWYDRLHRADHGMPLTRAQVDEMNHHLRGMAILSIRKWNGRQLASELYELALSADGSGLPGGDQALLREMAYELRNDAEMHGYRKEHDGALDRLLSLIVRAPVAWAEEWTLRLERFRGRHRWWL